MLENITEGMNMKSPIFNLPIFQKGPFIALIIFACSERKTGMNGVFAEI